MVAMQSPFGGTVFGSLLQPFQVANNSVKQRFEQCVNVPQMFAYPLLSQLMVSQNVGIPWSPPLPRCYSTKPSAVSSVYPHRAVWRLPETRASSWWLVQKSMVLQVGSNNDLILHHSSFPQDPLNQLDELDHHNLKSSCDTSMCSPVDSESMPAADWTVQSYRCRRPPHPPSMGMIRDRNLPSHPLRVWGRIDISLHSGAHLPFQQT